METPKPDTPKQQLLLGGAPVYTTVGSVYTKQSLPLQPPARRGRTVKWPPSDYPSKASLAGFPLRSQMSPPTTANSLLQYSPLQQNAQRAMSPHTASPESAAPNLSSTLMGSGKQSSTSAEDGEDEDEGHDNLKQMSVKTLHNLASFPNPMQKAAQNKLTRARTAPTSAPGLRDTRSDPVLMNNHQYDGVSEYGTQLRRDSPFNAGSHKIPGAPQPLTAGPPGLRQHKTVTDTMYPYVHPQVRSNADRPTSTHTHRSIPNTDNHHLLEDTYSRRNLSHRSGVQPRETDQEWTKDSPPLEPRSVPFDRPQEDLKAHQARVNSWWYAGNERLNKTMDEVIREEDRRHLERTIGSRIARPEARPSTTWDKISINEANRIPIYEHAEPLLSLVFQSMMSQIQRQSQNQKRELQAPPKF